MSPATTERGRTPATSAGPRSGGRPPSRPRFGSGAVRRATDLLVGKPRTPSDAFGAGAVAPTPARAAKAAARVRTARDSSSGAARRAIGVAKEADGDSSLLQLGLVLSAVGLSLLVFLAYTFVFTGLQEARNQHSMLELFNSNNLTVKKSVLKGLHLKDGQPIALLEIPALGLHQVVVKGTSSTDLLEGPGLMPDTALPGTRGNAVIAGRRSTAGAPFANLLSLQRGDRITVVTSLGSFKYSVRSVGTALSGGRDPISSTAAAQLTLVTSNPPLLATGRAYVVSTLVSKPVDAPLPKTPPNQSQRGLSGDASAIFPALVWGCFFVLSLFAVIAAYRRWRDRVWAIYLLSTPIVLTIALLCFENVYRLLPATL
jgi:sortase A